MRGQEQLIAMRRRRIRPQIVFVEVGPDPMRSARDWHEFTPHRAYLEIDDSEPISGLDMRCVVGMSVVVCGSDSRRVDAVKAACIDSEASRVVAAVYGGAVTDTAEA